MTRHWLSQPLQWSVRDVYPAFAIMSSRDVPRWLLRLAKRAQPYAPMSSGVSQRVTSVPVSSSSARTTASFLIVPPCTTMWLPSCETSLSFKTLYRQFFTTE